MSNYRRLISYIYAYEGGIKGKNIGFAKIETRGVQCKITVSVKKVYVGGNDIGVYLLAGEKEILLGNIFIRGGSGEFRTVVSVNDVEHSGIPMDQCYGLTVHDVENTWRSYTTIWEDAVAHAAEVELSNTLPEKKDSEETVQDAQIKKAIKEIEEEFPVEPVQEIKRDGERQEKVAREQLKAFTENAREQSKAFAESIRRRVERSADSAEQTAEAWIKQQESRIRQPELNASYIEPVSEPLRPEEVPEEEPPKDIHGQKEPVADADRSIREPYRQQESARMMHAAERSRHKNEDSLRGYSGFSGIPAVEYASELMPDIETVTTIHTRMQESGTQRSYIVEENPQDAFVKKSGSEGEAAERLHPQERTENSGGYLENIPAETVCYRADTAVSFGDEPEAGEYSAYLKSLENPQTMWNGQRMHTAESNRADQEMQRAADEREGSEWYATERLQETEKPYTTESAQKFAQRYSEEDKQRITEIRMAGAPQRGMEMEAAERPHGVSEMASVKDVRGVPEMTAVKDVRGVPEMAAVKDVRGVPEMAAVGEEQEVHETYSTESAQEIEKSHAEESMQTGAKQNVAEALKENMIKRAAEGAQVSSGMRAAEGIRNLERRPDKKIEYAASEPQMADESQNTSDMRTMEEARKLTETGAMQDEHEQRDTQWDTERDIQRDTQRDTETDTMEAAQNFSDMNVINSAHETRTANVVSETSEEQTAGAERNKLESHLAQEARPAPGDPRELERLLKTEEEEESSSDQIWDKLRREHTKVQDFDYEKGCEILTIKPQDIGLLPREVWVYGNNSFLLHGYYNYRYLILAKLFNPEGAPRYLLGVPGHFYSNERYMASMFGFPNFVLSKNQPMEDGRFGYWYTDIKIGN